FAEANRREESLVPGGRNALLELFPLRIREHVRIEILDGELLAREWRRNRRKRLRRPDLLTRDLGLRRNRAFFNRPDRLPGHAIEDVQKSSLPGHCYG